MSPALFLWCCVRDALGWKVAPCSCEEVQNLILKNGVMIGNKATLTVVAAGMWVIWRVRNDWVFRNVLMNNVIQLSYRMLSFLKQWTPLVPEKMKDWLEEFRGLLDAKIRQIHAEEAVG